MQCARSDQGDGTFVVDSFFDIDYRIDFVGAVGGQLDGLSGSTTSKLRMIALGNGFSADVAAGKKFALVLDTSITCPIP